MPRTRDLPPRLAARFDASVERLRRRLEARRSTLRIPPPIDAVDWIEANIYLPKGASAEGGTPFKMYGYQRALVRLATAPGTERLVVPKGTRTGITQTFTAIQAFHLAYEGSPVGIWQPTDQKAKSYADSYWTPVFRDSPTLRHLVRRPVKGEILDRWDERLYTNGAKAYIRFATSDDQFRGDTIRSVAGDEVDADGWKVGRAGSQGNKFRLMRERTRTFWNGKQYLWSSPLDLATSNIWPEWELSDQRRYFVRCPHCEGTQHLQWGGAKTDHGIKWSKNADGYVTDAWYVCEHKGCIIQEESKYAMDAEAGDAPPESGLGWQPTRVASVPGLVGAHIPAYISLFAKASWRNLAQEWLDAQGKPDDLKTFINNVLGEPTRDVLSRTVSIGGLGDRAEPYCAEIPDEVLVVTIGVDSQQGSADQSAPGAKLARHEVSVWGWGAAEEAWLIGHYVLDRHDPFSTEAQAELKDLITRAWRRRDGSTLHAAATFVDAGWQTNEAIAFAERPDLARWNVKAVRGESGNLARTAPVIGTAEGKTKNGRSFIRVGTHSAKNTLDRRLRIVVPGPGYVHFPKALGDARHDPAHPLRDYFEDLLAEGVKKDRHGREEWVRKGARTGEAWDCMVYCFAALEWVRRRYRRIALALADRTGPDPAERPRHEGDDRSAMAEMGDIGILARPLAPEASAPQPRPAEPAQARQAAPAQPAKRSPVRVRSSFASGGGSYW